MQGDEDREFILSGIREGFDIIPGTRDIPQSECDNSRSATNPDTKPKVDKQIHEEISQGHYVVTKDKPRIISSLAAIPKGDNSDSIRLIHDASRPEGQSVNSLSAPDSFAYEGMDEAVKLLSKNDYMCKIDLKWGYRSVPIHPKCYPATGLKWKFGSDTEYSYLYDTRLPFGANQSPAIFTRITQSVSRMMKRRNIKAIIVYLDDFWIRAATKEEAKLAMDILLKLLMKLGFSIQWRKLVPPTQILTFLGLEINTIEQTLRLPVAKVQELKLCVQKWENKSSFSKKELQHILGKFNWAARMFRVARPLMRRLIDKCKILKKPSHRVRLDSDTREDLQMWGRFLGSDQFNGVTYYLRYSSRPEFTFSTDACDVGGAGWHHNAKQQKQSDKSDWFYTNWQADNATLMECDINVKELAAIKRAVDRWGHMWHNKHVTVYTDNVACQYWINRGTTRSIAALEYLKPILYSSVIHNFYLTAKRVKSCDNVTADAISRFHDLNMAASAHAMLQQFNNIDIADHAYPLFEHMSIPSFLSILQAWQAKPSNGTC